MKCVTYNTTAKLAAATLLISTLSGCDWFDNDKDLVPPEAEFTVSATQGEAPLLISFKDASTHGSANIYQWVWDFGDGASSSKRSPNYRYQQPGTYSVSLTVTSEDGSDTVTRTDLIQVDAVPPTADFRHAPVTGSLQVTFTDNSEAGSYAVSGWLWDFGDGATSTEQHPQHTYQEAGTYNVSLSVTAGNTTSESVSQSLTLTSPYIPVTLNLVNDAGHPIKAAAVSSESFDIQSQSLNEFSQLTVQLSPQETSGVLRVSAEGYTDALVYLENVIGKQQRQVTLLKRGNHFKVDPSKGGHFMTNDGAKITLLSNSFVDEQGNPISDELDLYITTVDVSDDIEVNGFPGSYIGIPNGYPDMNTYIASYGTVEMGFYLNGEKLQLRDGMYATLELPIYVTQHIGGDPIEVNDMIPFWILNEQTGIWEQHGYGSVFESGNSPTGLALSATTNHFSWFNTDAWGVPGATPIAIGETPSDTDRPNFCNVSIDIEGPEIGDVLELRMSRRLPGWPLSTIRQTLNFDGESIQTRLSRGTTYGVAAVDQDYNYASERFVCGSTQEIHITLQLPNDGLPEFLLWDASIRPVFAEVDGLQTITHNIVEFGGTFELDEDNLAEVSTDFLLGSMLLPSGGTREFELTEEEGLQHTVTAKIENTFGEDQVDFELDYIREQSPDVTRLSVVKNTSTLGVAWGVSGADFVTVHYTEGDPLILGPVLADFFASSTIGAINLPENNGLELTGYLQIVFSNQYGDTIHYVKLTNPVVSCSLDFCGPV